MCAHLQGLRRRAAHLQLLYAGQPGCSHVGAAVAACSGSRPRLKPQPVQQVARQQHHASPSRLPTNQHAGTMHHMHPSLAHAPPATDRDERRYSWGLEVSCQRLQPSWQAPLSPAACHQGRMGGLHQPLEGAGKAPGGGAAWRGLGGSGAAGRMIQHALNSCDEVDAGGGTHTGGASVHACPATPPPYVTAGRLQRELLPAKRSAAAAAAPSRRKYREANLKSVGADCIGPVSASLLLAAFLWRYIAVKEGQPGERRTATAPVPGATMRRPCAQCGTRAAPSLLVYCWRCLGGHQCCAPRPQLAPRRCACPLQAWRCCARCRWRTSSRWRWPLPAWGGGKQPGAC